MPYTTTKSLISLADYITIDEIKALIHFYNHDKEGIYIGKQSRREFEDRGGLSYHSVLDDKDKPNVVKMVKTINQTFKQEKELHLLTIYPLGFVANCHINIRKAVYLLNKMKGKEEFEMARGYNFTSSRDAEMVVAEVHSVLRHKETGYLFDLTDDFDKSMKHKFFIEVDWITDYYDDMVLNKKTRTIDFIYSKAKHIENDGLEWNAQYLGTRTILRSDFREHFETIENLYECLPYYEKLNHKWTMFADMYGKKCAIHTNDGIMSWEDIKSTKHIFTYRMKNEIIEHPFDGLDDLYSMSEYDERQSEEDKAKEKVFNDASFLNVVQTQKKTKKKNTKKKGGSKKKK